MNSETPDPPPDAPPRPRRAHAAALAWRVARLPLLAYLAIVLGMTFLETWLVYPTPPVDRADWNPAGDHEDVRFASADGTRLHGWFYDRPGARYALLYCHGNGNMIADNHELMTHLRDRLGAAVFSFDYRGYGKSEGRPSERGLIDDGVAAADWLAARTGRPADELVVIGRSLGGGVAAGIAAERGAGALVLQNTFSRITDVAAGRFPWLPVRLLMRNRFDSIDRLARYDGPLLMSHGTRDEVVPYQLGRRLFDASPSPVKTWIDLPDYTHNRPQPMSYYGDLRAFLEQIPAASRSAE